VSVPVTSEGATLRWLAHDTLRKVVRNLIDDGALDDTYVRDVLDAHCKRIEVMGRDWDTAAQDALAERAWFDNVG
jgi:hypothetical protein